MCLFICRNREVLILEARMHHIERQTTHVSLEGVLFVLHQETDVIDHFRFVFILACKGFYVFDEACELDGIEVGH